MKPLEPHIDRLMNILSNAMKEAESKLWESNPGLKLSNTVEALEIKLKRVLEQYVDKVLKTSFASDETVMRQSVRVITFAPPILLTIFIMSIF